MLQLASVCGLAYLGAPGPAIYPALNVVPNPPLPAVHTVRARSAGVLMTVEPTVELESEFETVKAAALAAEAMPVEELTAPRRRKRDRIAGAAKRVGSWFGMARDIREEAKGLIDDSCDIEEEEVCADEGAKKRVLGQLVGLIGKTVRGMARGDGADDAVAADPDADGAAADAMEAGWQTRSQGSALRRTIEVWGFLASAVIKVIKAGKAKGGDDEVSAAKTAAAEFIRDGLFRLGPTFVKLGQVVSTRTDVVEKEYIAVLKDLQDNVPGFGGEKAKAIIAAELGKPVDELFDSFETTPIAAASLGQVHRATYKGQQVAVKVQRAGLKELFDTDLKNLKVLAKLLDKFDPKSDGADRSYADIYDESAKLLYEEIDYELEGKNCERFARSFEEVEIDYVKVPSVYWSLTTPRVLTLEFVPSFKLTDLDQVDSKQLDRKQLAERTADAFLTQILKTSYFHCDPHPGNLCVNTEGQLVYYDCGMMNELSPNVAAGFKEACFAVFGGGPFISEITLAKNAKRLVDALELMGVLAKGADRLSVEKLARYFIGTFKAVQQGKAPENIKSTLGADLQALTEQQVFRFPSTFTFIFRAFASIDGIGKGLDPEYDLAKFAQPFINELTETGYDNDVQKWASRLSSATGLNKMDLDTAITQPKKVAYLEETVRSMEQGTLKIRVRSLENERALARLSLGQQVTNNALLASLLLNIALSSATRYPAIFFAASGFFGLKAGGSSLQIKLFDKKAAKYETKDFGD